MSEPLVSIIVPAFNAGRYIGQSITSLLQQSYTNLELIVINDGSTDNTADVIKSFSDKRIRYFEQQNSGQCKASNAGLRQAAGELIRFFDADDIMNREHIELQVKKLNTRTDAVGSCEWGRFYNAIPESARFEPGAVWQDMKSLDWLKTCLQDPAAMMGGWLWLIPRAIIDKAGGWDERLGLNNDFEFSIRLLLKANEVLFTPGAKLYYRTGDQTLSVTKTKAAYEAAYLSTQLGCSYLLGAENSALMRRLCANRYQQWIYQLYPSYPDLCSKMEQEISKLGGSDAKVGGGIVLKSLTVFFGWKMAKRIQSFFYKLGYKTK